MMLLIGRFKCRVISGQAVLMMCWLPPVTGGIVSLQVPMLSPDPQDLRVGLYLELRVFKEVMKVK